MLTTNTIARWLANELGDTDTLMHRDIRHVLTFNERKDQAVFLPHDATATKVIATLTSTAAHDTLPRLVIITEDGNANQHPLGVITASNLAALFDAA